MSGFSPGLMQSMMTAGTALTAAQVSTNAISQMNCRKQTLEAEIASGNGDIEGKQAEIERIDAQSERAQNMQQSALSSAATGLGSALTAAGGDKTEDKADAARTEDDQKTPGEEARKKAAQLGEKLPECDIAAVDFAPGMHMDTGDGRTSIAVSPAFLDRMASDAALDAEYAQHFETMQSLRHEPESQIETQSFSVAWDGTIREHVTAAAGATGSDLAALRAQRQEAGEAAFGSVFGGVSVTRQREPATGNAAATGRLVDKAL